MKMESTITAPRAETVARLTISQIHNVDGGDLILQIDARS
jgi:pyruvate carboxylase